MTLLGATTLTAQLLAFP